MQLPCVIRHFIDHLTEKAGRASNRFLTLKCSPLTESSRGDERLFYFALQPVIRSEVNWRLLTRCGHYLRVVWTGRSGKVSLRKTWIVSWQYEYEHPCAFRADRRHWRRPGICTDTRAWSRVDHALVGFGNCFGNRRIYWRPHKSEARKEIKTLLRKLAHGGFSCTDLASWCLHAAAIGR